ATAAGAASSTTRSAIAAATNTTPVSTGSGSGTTTGPSAESGCRKAATIRRRRRSRSRRRNAFGHSSRNQGRRQDSRVHRDRRADAAKEFERRDRSPHLLYGLHAGRRRSRNASA